MVKRLLGAAAFAAVAAVVWVLFNDRPTSGLENETAITSCVRGDLVECVSYKVPVETPSSVAAQSCKAWLNGSASPALLSHCLHTTSVERARAEADEARRERLIRTSS